MDFSKKFGGMSDKVKELAEKGKGLAERGKSMLKPPPVIFGAPRQLASEADVSWWHVPIFIQPSTMHKKELENCRVKMVSFEGGGAALDMRWRTKDSKEPLAEVTLTEGRLYLVPIAARKEAGKRAAIITNESFLAEKKIKLQMPAGKSKWVLRVENKEGKWESEHSYVLMVPSSERGNGHFVLEVRYDGLN
ncbi:MAG: hypothetical protein R3174_09120 [Gammaproteobacteria bacterium]|nr:hypothetical protein [Gammaproteobacteria bacterium]